MAALTDFGLIRSDELYTLERLKQQLDLTDAAYRELRDAGLPEIKKGKRKYFIGKHVIQWFAGEWDDSRVRGAAASNLAQSAAAVEGGEEVAGALSRHEQPQGSGTRGRRSRKTAQ